MNRVLIAILRVVLPLVVLGLGAFGTYVLIESRPEVPMVARKVDFPGVRVQTVRMQDVPLTVVSQGTVSPRTESQLVPQVSGQVIWGSPSFAEGAFFEAGDVLLRIDPYDYQQSVITARAQLAQSRLRLAQEEAEAEVARREWAELGRGDATALTLRGPQLDDARAAVAAAEANLDRAQRDLERAEVRASFAGRVRQKNVDVGQYVSVGTTLATVYAVDVAEVRLPLPDPDLAYLDLPLAYRGGVQRASPRVTLRAAFAGQTYEWQGQVVRTEAEIDPVSRMVHVVAEVADPYAAGAGSDPDRPPLAVGMFVTAEIEGRVARQVVSLPRAALRGEHQVLVVDADDRVHFRTVNVLRRTTNEVVITGGLQAGERVSLSPLEAVTEGMQVEVIEVLPGADDAPAVENVRTTGEEGAVPSVEAGEGPEDRPVSAGVDSLNLSDAPALDRTEAARLLDQMLREAGY